MNNPPKDVFLVIGGSGMLGREIAKQLLDRGDIVSVLDIIQRYDDIPFYPGDITEQGVVLSVLKKSGATCVIHTAGPHASKSSAELLHKVIVNGTQQVISACLETGVRKLVYTSSSGVVFDGNHLENADETFPTKPGLGPYFVAKIEAEAAVIAANKKGNLLTTSLRPSGIFGPGDDQTMRGFWNSFDYGRTGVQIGDNKGLTDWTYVSNAAYAHVLAADRLSVDASPPVAGETFFITNDDPIPFWDFANGVWDRFGKIYPEKRIKKKPFVIPRSLAYIFAFISEQIAWITGKPATFTKFNVVFICTTRWHNIEKAKKALGYKPNVSLEEGLDLSVDWWMGQLEKERQQTAKSTTD